MTKEHITEIVFDYINEVRRRGYVCEGAIDKSLDLECLSYRGVEILAYAVAKHLLNECNIRVTGGKYNA